MVVSPLFIYRGRRDFTIPDGILKSIYFQAQKTGGIKGITQIFLLSHSSPTPLSKMAFWSLELYTHKIK